jgi:elongation factor P
MPALIGAIEIKRKMFFECDGAPYHCIDVEVSRPTARGDRRWCASRCATLLTRAVFDKTLRPVRSSPSRSRSLSATFSYSDGEGYHFMDQETFETLTISADTLGDDRQLVVDNVSAGAEMQRAPIGISFTPHVERR